MARNMKAKALTRKYRLESTVSENSKTIFEDNFLQKINQCAMLLFRLSSVLDKNRLPHNLFIRSFEKIFSWFSDLYIKAKPL